MDGEPRKCAWLTLLLMQRHDDLPADRHYAVLSTQTDLARRIAKEIATRLGTLLSKSQDLLGRESSDAVGFSRLKLICSPADRQAKNLPSLVACPLPRRHFCLSITMGSTQT